MTEEQVAYICRGCGMKIMGGEGAPCPSCGTPREQVAFDLAAVKERLKDNPSDDDANYGALWDALHEIERLERTRQAAYEAHDAEGVRLLEQIDRMSAELKRLQRVNQHLEDELVTTRTVRDQWLSEYVKLRDSL